MTTRPDHLAKEADRLLNDEILNHAIDAARQEALEALATTPAENTHDIMREQAVVRAFDELTTVLERHIIAEAD